MLEIPLKANVATLECSVTGSSHKPLPEAQVVLLSDGERRPRMALWGQCRTYADGKCTLLGMSPGEYHAFAFAKGRIRKFSIPIASRASRSRAKQ